MTPFLTHGLAATDLARLQATLEAAATKDGIVTVGTWSPTRRVVVVVAALKGQVLTWHAMPADSEAEGKAAAESAFTTMSAWLAQQTAGAAVDNARLQ